MFLPSLDSRDSHFAPHPLVRFSKCGPGHPWCVCCICFQDGKLERFGSTASVLQSMSPKIMFGSIELEMVMNTFKINLHSYLPALQSCYTTQYCTQVWFRASFASPHSLVLSTSLLMLYSTNIIPYSIISIT